MQRVLHVGRKRFLDLIPGVARHAASAAGTRQGRWRAQLGRIGQLRSFDAQQRHDFGQRDRRRGGIAPRLVFDLALFQSALADGDAVRDADQFEIGEHHAGALAAIVEQHLDAGRLELVVQLIAAARTASLRSNPIGAMATVNGASGAGQMMPRSSKFCSMAAATTRVMPMP